MAAGALMTNVAEHQIVTYAKNHLARRKTLDPGSLDKLEVTGMRNFQAMTKFSVKDDNFKNKLTKQLQATDCPKEIISAIVDEIDCTEEEMSVQSDCRVENGEGVLYKIAYCLSKEDGKAKFAMMVFGASFKGDILERFEESREPVLRERKGTRTEGMLWWKATHEFTELVQVGELVVKKPVLKGLTNRDLQASMDMLEAKACEKVVESCPLPPAVETSSPNSDETAKVDTNCFLLVMGIVAIFLFRG